MLFVPFEDSEIGLKFGGAGGGGVVVLIRIRGFLANIRTGKAGPSVTE